MTANRYGITRKKEDQHLHLPASTILSTLASLIPLICRSSLRGEYATASTVHKPASFNFFMSRAAIPEAFRI